MRIATLFVASLLLAAACGGKKPVAEKLPSPHVECQLDGPNGTPATAQQCTCAGMMPVGDIGNGSVACPEGAIEVSKISFGIEGGVCCAKGEPAAP
jgi:hypothetical protein